MINRSKTTSPILSSTKSFISAGITFLIQFQRINLMTGVLDLCPFAAFLVSGVKLDNFGL